MNADYEHLWARTNSAWPQCAVITTASLYQSLYYFWPFYCLIWPSTL